jgi:acyl dehydratase
MEDEIKDNGLFFDDLVIGQKFKSGTHQLNAAEITAFASRFDPQPFHLDEATAKQTLFGGLVASGWHTGAITMRLIIGDGSPIAGGIISKGGEISWLKPVHPGDILHVESEITEKIPSKSNPARGTAIIRSETINQYSEVVQVLKAILIVPRRG